GEVFGLTVRARNIGSQFGATLKSLVGGELKGMTKMLAEGRMHAQERLVEEAEARGANAVIAFRFDTSELGTTWTEICAYGIAVLDHQVAHRAALDRLGPPAEQLAVEGGSSIEVGRRQLVPAKRAGRVDEPCSDLRFGLPHHDERALRILDHRHASGLDHVERTSVHSRAQLAGSLRRGIAALDGDVGIPCGRPS